MRSPARSHAGDGHSESGARVYRVEVVDSLCGSVFESLAHPNRALGREQHTRDQDERDQYHQQPFGSRRQPCGLIPHVAVLAR
jgi:hypothetical protein